MDFCGPLPSGEYLLILVDEYSRFPVVAIINSTAASTVIPVVDKIFTNFSIPEITETDNGSPFQGENGNRIQSTWDSDVAVSAQDGRWQIQKLRDLTGQS